MCAAYQVTEIRLGEEVYKSQVCELGSTSQKHNRLQRTTLTSPSTIMQFIAKLSIVALACIVGGDAAIVTRRGNVVRSTGLERRQGSDVCFSEAEGFCIVAESVAPTIEDCQALADGFANDDESFSIPAGSSESFNLPGGTCKFTVTNTGTTDISMCASRIADAGAFPALINSCLPPNTDEFTGWLWESTEGPSWTFEVSRCIEADCAPVS